jgi:hypothetical protein
MVSQRLSETGFMRADLASGEAWTLHTPDHGNAFLEALPRIIKYVEMGWHPSVQAGDFDLQLDAWLGADSSLIPLE